MQEELIATPFLLKVFDINMAQEKQENIQEIIALSLEQ
jgi:hypothetical protein